jgi:squalene-hopene/tetraprenyl-beta-curcumene cyclase
MIGMSIGILVSKQNGDGGWPYVRGGSWTEPTVYAVLALLAAGEIDPARRGLQWIRAAQRPDGGWPARPGVDESGWVTALAALLPPERLDPRVHARAVAWLLRTTGRESTPAYRIREWLLGNTPPPDQRFPGWPWVPGAAAWVSPTAIALLALDKQFSRVHADAVARRLDEGRRYLLLHVCKDGGWNHGSTRALGYESRAYPETTGMALAALRGVKSPAVESSIAAARRFLDASRSADAVNWLRLGLLAHGQLPAGYCPPPDLACRTLSEAGLEVLVSEAEKGRNFFYA